jgi:uncharacterized repeat protein (TIGR01451 family)
MKKFLIFSLLVLPLFAQSQFSVTFMVDMNAQSVSPNGVHITGNFGDPNDDSTDENPGLLNWDPTAYEMTDADMDGIYEYTFSLAEGVYEFKYINGNNVSGEEVVPEACQTEGELSGNRQLIVENLVEYWVAFGSCSRPGYLARRFRLNTESLGSFQDVYVTWGEGDGHLHDINEDGVYEYYSYYNLLEYPDTLFWQYSIDNGMYEGNGLSCFYESRKISMEDDNIVLPVNCWSSCTNCVDPVNVTFNLDLREPYSEAHSLKINGLTFASTDPTDYELYDEDLDGVYSRTFQLQPNSLINHDFTLLDYSDPIQSGYPFYTYEAFLYGFESNCARTLQVGYSDLVIDNCWNKCDGETCIEFPDNTITFNIDMSPFGEGFDYIVLHSTLTRYGLIKKDLALYDPDNDNIYSGTFLAEGEDKVYFTFRTVHSNPDLNDISEFAETAEEMEQCNNFDVETNIPYYVWWIRDLTRTDENQEFTFVWGECDVFESTNDYAYLDGMVFYDMNQNGIFDTGDQPAPNIPIIFDSQNIADYTNNNGEFYFVSNPGEHMVEYLLPENYYFTSGNTGFNGTIEPGNNNHLEPVGIYSTDLIPNISTSIIGVGVVCNETGYFAVVTSNNGIVASDVVLSLELAPEILFDFASHDIDSIIGNIYYFTIENIQPGDNFPFQFVVQWPDFTQMGQSQEVYLSACTSDGLSCAEDMWSAPLLCAYDPNDKTPDPVGWTDEHFILTGEPIEYLVRFQNTGNYQASNIRIEDQLSPNLDWTTLQVIGTSHELSDIAIDETGRVTFYFNYINLPDYVSDELASHGYVLYKIEPLAQLAPMTTIPNTAEIYFDFNPAVFTNTTTHTIFDCSLMTTDIVMEAMACAGDLYTQNQEVEYAENYTWTLDGEEVGNTEILSYPTTEAGTLNFQLEASNPLCTATFNFPVDVIQNPTIPVITQNGNVLTATSGGMNYVWYLDGTQVFQGNTNTYLASVSGSYSVQITNEFGCSSLSDTAEITVGIDGPDALQWFISPNPATTQITIQCALAGKKSITLYNALNQIVFTSSMPSNTFVLERNDLPAGVYYLDLVVESAQISDSKKIIFE